MRVLQDDQIKVFVQRIFKIVIQCKCETEPERFDLRHSGHFVKLHGMSNLGMDVDLDFEHCWEQAHV